MYKSPFKYMFNRNNLRFKVYFNESQYIFYVLKNNGKN